MELLAQVGHDLPGAIRILPAEAAVAGGMPVVVEGGVGGALAKQVRDVGWRFSLAGVGLKFSMLRSDDRFTCPATGIGGDWILKLPDSIHSNVPLNEYTMMKLAAAVGIDVPEVMLVHRDQVEGLPANTWPSGEEWAFAVRRFDRSADRGLIHIEDLAQVRGVYPLQKYEGNYETVAGLVYRSHDVHALREFVRRLTLFALIGNGDAHLKNWSLIYRDRRTPTLSPAYDIVSTEAYRPDASAEELGMKFAGSRRFEAMRVSHFQRLERKFGTSLGLAQTASDLVHAVVERWPQFADGMAAAPVIRDTVTKAVTERSRSLLGTRAS